jgi:hypothetical protein
MSAATMAVHLRRTTRRAQAVHARLAAGRRRRGQSIRSPTVASSTGSRVRVAATLMAGTSIPPIPMLRSAGAGSTISDSSPIATVTPLKATDRPAVAIARVAASSRSWPAPSSSRHRVTSSSE